MKPGGALLAGGALALMALSACAAPLSAPADTTRAASQAGGSTGGAQARQILPIAPTALAGTPSFMPTATPESGAPITTPLAPTASAVAPALPTLTLPARAPLDAASQAALASIQSTVAAQVLAATATAQALPVMDVLIQDFVFSPSTLTVKPGTTIVWRNFDRVQHQITGGEFDSGRIHGGFHWAQVIGKPGRYQFFCSFHPTMRAEVTVSPDDTRPLHLGS
jgi:plastocyanin